MQELDRRSSGWISWRDLFLEVVVIGLIGFEIVLAIKQGRDEDALMAKQNGILATQERSTSATASAVRGLSDLTRAMGDSTSASAKTLISLRTLTETMNRGVQDQVQLFYDPSVALMYLQDQNRLNFINSGRSGLTMTALSIDGQPKNLDGPKLIAGGTTLYVEVADLYDAVSKSLTKGTVRDVPIEVTLQNELGKKFRMNANLFFVWEKDKVAVHGQTYSLSPEQ